MYVKHMYVYLLREPWPNENVSECCNIFAEYEIRK